MTVARNVMIGQDVNFG